MVQPYIDQWSEFAQDNPKLGAFGAINPLLAGGAMGAYNMLPENIQGGISNLWDQIYPE